MSVHHRANRPAWLCFGVIALVCAGCVDYNIKQRNDPPSGWERPLAYLFVPGMPDEGACEQVQDEDVSISIDESCASEPGQGDLDAVLEWRIIQFGNFAEYNQAVMAPMVGQLTDDDADGALTPADTPDVVIIMDDDGVNDNDRGVIRLLAGDGSGELVSTNRVDLGEGDATKQLYPYRYSNVALGDVDKDGTPEIILQVQVIGGAGGGGEDSGKGPPKPAETGAPPDTGGGGEEGGGGDDIRPNPPPSSGSSGGSGGEAPEPQAQGCQIAAFNVSYDAADPGAAELTAKWVSSGLQLECGGHAPALADLEGDGSVEIVLGSAVLEGASGSLRGQGTGDTGRYLAYDQIGLHSIVSDLDGDGTQEIIAGRTLYGPSGQQICTGSGGSDGFAAAADLDLDGQGEFVVVGNGQATIYEADCAAAGGWTLAGGGNGGPPTIADYDGDGAPEIGLVDATTYTVYEVDGTVLWSAPVTDASSHATGSVVFDFEGDGFAEVVYGDEVSLWVFDGRTGEVRFKDNTHESRTLHEFPTVADVDGDGSAEILSVNGGSHYGESAVGIYVFGSQSNAWQAGRQVWNQHAYSIVNVEDDLSIPAGAAPNWPLYNNFRSGDVNPLSGGSSPDAIALAEPCLQECAYGRVVIRARVANQGASALRADLPVTLYGVQGGVLVALETRYTEAALAPGEISPALVFDVDIKDLPDGAAWIYADDIPSGDFAAECNETNNGAYLQDLTCP